MPFKVMKQYPRGRETFCAEFINLDGAKQYIQENLGAEAAMKVAVTYRIYEWDELVGEFDAATLPAAPVQDTGGNQGQGKGSEITFKPTPFNLAPRPTGMPQNWVKDKEEGEDEDKEGEKK